MYGIRFLSFVIHSLSSDVTLITCVPLDQTLNIDYIKNCVTNCRPVIICALSV